MSVTGFYHMKLPKKYLADLDNLSWIDPITKRYQLIGLGEATHGNKDFHTIRATISKYLISHHGYSGVIMEFPHSKSETINQFILTGKGDLTKIMHSLGYWTCQTEEIRDFILWLQKYNIDNSEGRVCLYGNDVSIDDKIRLKPAKYRDKKMSELTLTIAKNKKYVVWSHNHHISKFDEGNYESMGSFLNQKVSYFSVATLFFEGSLTAMEYKQTDNAWGEIKQFTLPPAEHDSLEFFLQKTHHDNFFIDITNLPLTVRQQFKNVKARFLGAGYDPNETASMFQRMNFEKMFDGIIFFRTVLPSSLI